jgi:hypothetical protein
VRPSWLRPCERPCERPSSSQIFSTPTYANPFFPPISLRMTYASLLLSPSLVPIRKRRYKCNRQEA